MNLNAELDRCNKCGFCMQACPTYKVSATEWLLTRGRISLIKDALAGDLDQNDPDYRDAIDSCLMCRACVEVCPSKIQMDFVTTRAKALRREKHGFTWSERFIYRQLLPRPGLFKAVIRTGHYTEKLGLRRLALRSGMLKRWPVLARAAAIGPSLPGTTGRKLIARAAATTTPTPANPRERVVYFLGCSKNLLYPQAALATYRVLTTNDVAVTTPKVACCGLPALSAGDLEGARALARQNMAILSATEGPIVVDESSCGSHIAHWGDLFEGMPEEAEVRKLAARVVDLTVYLARLGIKPTSPMPVTVAWHDPCHLRHHLHVTQEPRRLLSQVPGVKLVEANPDGGCCGGAGSFMLSQAELSDEILATRLETVRAAGAEMLVTSSPSCITQYARGAGELPVLYISEFLDLAYQASRNK